MKHVMVTKGLRGRENPELYHEQCLDAVRAYYADKGEEVEITSYKGVSNNFDGSTANKRLYGLGMTLANELAIADEVVFMDDWEKYDGCLSEHYICVRYGVKCVYLTSNFKEEI